MAATESYPGLPDQPGWTGLDQLVDTMRLTKAALLTGDREQASLMVQRLVGAYGPDGAAEVYRRCVDDVKTVKPETRTWWLASLLES